MEHGTHCHLAECFRLSFLPLSCPFCRHLFCESHFLPNQHTCGAPGAKESNTTLTQTELVRRVLRANQAATSGEQGYRLPCQKRACKAFSLQVNAAGQDPVQHDAPSCHRCNGLFCMSHRTPRAHDCTAPAPLTEGQQRMAAAEERKRKARELIAKNFPSKAKNT